MKFAKWCAVILIAAIAVVAIYKWLDTAVTLNYARQQQKTDEADGDLLREIVLLQAKGTKRTEVNRWVRETFATGHLVKELPNEISVDDVVFRFDDNHVLTGIRFASRSTEP